MKITKLDISKLEQNAGQIEGLPTNPRTWTQKDVESLARSLIETPELFEARPIIVIPHGEKYVILGGNMRYEASRLNGATDVPCIIFPASLSFDKMREIVIKDNGSWGYWDYTLLENDWSENPLQDWGVPEHDAKGGDKTLINPYSFKLTSPIYQIQGMKPSEADIVNTEKVDALLSEIDAAPVPEKVKKMLRVCAYRHAVIDFEGMAEYYAHANKTVQRLMESNALVIIDFDKAVENGFVKMTKDLQDIYDKNTEALKDAE